MWRPPLLTVWDDWIITLRDHCFKKIVVASFQLFTRNDHDNGCPVHDHDLVMGYGVFVVDIGVYPWIGQKGSRCAFLFSLTFIEYGLNLSAAFMGSEKGFGNWDWSKGICLDKDSLLCLIDLFDDGICRTSARTEIDRCGGLVGDEIRNWLVPLTCC